MNVLEYDHRVFFIAADGSAKSGRVVLWTDNKIGLNDSIQESMKFKNNLYKLGINTVSKLHSIIRLTINMNSFITLLLKTINQFG